MIGRFVQRADAPPPPVAQQPPRGHVTLPAAWTTTVVEKWLVEQYGSRVPELLRIDAVRHDDAVPSFRCTFRLGDMRTKRVWVSGAHLRLVADFHGTLRTFTQSDAFRSATEAPSSTDRRPE